MTSHSRFGKASVYEAANSLEHMGHSDINNLMLRYQISEDIVPRGVSPSIRHKTNFFIEYAFKHPEHVTIDGRNLWNAIVEDVVYSAFEIAHVPPKLLHALDRDGYTIAEKRRDGAYSLERPQILINRKLPDSADLPKIDDEVHILLNELGLTTAKGHLDQAVDNHGRANWAAANGQLRTFMEELFDAIAKRIDPGKAKSLPTSENRRDLLATHGFLLEPLGEWGSQGKNFVNGLFKRLHGSGSHPGLSDEDDATFRLHICLITARVFLKRARTFTAST